MLLGTRSQKVASGVGRSVGGGAVVLWYAARAEYTNVERWGICCGGRGAKRRFRSYSPPPCAYVSAPIR
eukprot:2650718-Rhodomonas_salina.1